MLLFWARRKRGANISQEPYVCTTTTEGTMHTCIQKAKRLRRQAKSPPFLIPLIGPEKPSESHDMDTHRQMYMHSTKPSNTTPPFPHLLLPYASNFQYMIHRGDSLPSHIRPTRTKKSIHVAVSPFPPLSTPYLPTLLSHQSTNKQTNHAHGPSQSETIPSHPSRSSSPFEFTIQPA